MADTDAQYRNIDIALDVVTPANSRTLVEGAQPGVMIYGAYIMPPNFVDPAYPPGAQIKFFFGSGGEEIILTADVVSFLFRCGHSGGLYIFNGASLPGKILRLMIDYSGDVGAVYAN